MDYQAEWEFGYGGEPIDREHDPLDILLAEEEDDL